MTRVEPPSVLDGAAGFVVLPNSPPPDGTDVVVVDSNRPPPEGALVAGAEPNRPPPEGALVVWAEPKRPPPEGALVVGAEPKRPPPEGALVVVLLNIEGADVVLVLCPRLPNGVEFDLVTLLPPPNRDALGVA